MCRYTSRATVCWQECQVASSRFAAAVHDRRYGLGPVTTYVRDPQVENVDVTGWDQSLPNWPTPPESA